MANSNAWSNKGVLRKAIYEGKKMYDLGCEYYDYEPNEHRRCILLGYCFACGSQECKEARAEYETKEGAKADAKR